MVPEGEMREGSEPPAARKENRDLEPVPLEECDDLPIPRKENHCIVIVELAVLEVFVLITVDFEREIIELQELLNCAQYSSGVCGWHRG